MRLHHLAGPVRSCAALLFAAIFAHPASAQRLSGRLLDVASDAPIVAGLLTLRTVAGVSLVTAVTDTDGRWTLRAPEPGSYYVAASGLGYESWVSGPLEVKVGDDLTAVFHLRRRPLQLEPIEVTVAAMRRYLETAGFYERQRADFGHFMDPDEIRARRATRVTDLLLGLPGVNLVSMAGGGVGGRYVQFRGSDLSQGGLCRPRVFVDGLMYARGDSRPRRLRGEVAVEERVEEEMQRLDQGGSLDDIGPPSDILAIEVYRSATQVPVRFGGTSVETLCGVIAVWTRRGGLRRRN